VDTAGGAEPQYCCYGCHLAAKITSARGDQGHATWLLTRLGVSTFLSMGVMVFSLALYSHNVYGEQWFEGSALSRDLYGLMRYVLLLLATPVILLLGLPILSNAMHQLRSMRVATDALIVIGVAAAFGYSGVSTFRGSGPVYFETACMVLVLFTLGRYLEATGRLKATTAVSSLASLIPDDVAVWRNDREFMVPAEEVLVGDVLSIKAGDRVAADGRIESGSSHIDEQLLTGESAPVAKKVGDAVFAGTMNVDGMLRVRVEAIGGESAVGRLTELLEEARQSKGRYERMADRTVALFVPAVIAIAAVGALLGAAAGSAERMIMTPLSVLLIACPCALGIATPLAVWAGLGAAATRGVLFRNADALESLAGVRAVALDKTGTLTTGDATVVAFHLLSEDDASTEETLNLAARMAMSSNHPLSKAVCAYVAAGGIDIRQAYSTRTIPGRGIEAEVDGATVRLGNIEMMREAGVRMEENQQGVLARLADQGTSITCMARGRHLIGVFAFSETLRAEAHRAITRLRHIETHVAVLTGDQQKRGEAIAKTLEVPTWAGLSPAGKIEHLHRLRHEQGKVAMVGDGLNDAPALAAADIGIAMGCGADVSRENADICLMGNDLCALPWVVNHARRTVRTIRANLFWAFFYNVIGVSLALTGKLNPIFAAAAMVVSSIFVVSNSLRLARAGTGGDTDGQLLEEDSDKPDRGARPWDAPDTQSRNAIPPTDARTGRTRSPDS